MAAYTVYAVPVSVPPSGPVDLVFGGIDQAGPSFEGRVFLNNPDADERTAPTRESGYLGAFHVYGYGAPAPPAIADKLSRSPSRRPIAPIEKRLRTDGAALWSAVGDADELSVTVVPVPVDPGGPTPDRPFERVAIVFGKDAARERRD